MAPRSQNSLHRSCLIFPAHVARFVARAPLTDADMCIFDLEDSVPVEAKTAARSAAIEALCKLDWRPKTVGVRLNTAEDAGADGEVVQVVAHAGRRIDELVLPKVESGASVARLDRLLDRVERAHRLPLGGIGLTAQIESARGLARVNEIASSSPRLVSLVFGPADFAASMGMPGLPHVATNALVDHALACIAVAGRAYGLQVIDGPYFGAAGSGEFFESCARPASYGFDGKWAIHPDQVVHINRSFTPEPAEFSRACALLATFRRQSAIGEGAFVHEGQMVDLATCRLAERTVIRGEKAGLSCSEATTAGPAGPTT